MPHPVTPRITEPDGMLPSGRLWLPAAGLSACVRATVVRNTVGHVLADAQRFNHFPAAPLVSLSWWMVGSSENVLLTDDNRHVPLSAPRQPMPGRWVLGGPHTHPTCTWCPGPVHAMMVLLMPDAFHLLTGLAPEALTNRIVDAEAVLPPDWLPMLHDVQSDAVRWAEVAADTGYADHAHLYRVSRRVTGFSPEALRRGMAQDEAFWPYRLWM